MTDFSRRNFFKTATLPAGALGGLGALSGLATAASAATAPPSAAAVRTADTEALRWLDGTVPELPLGATLGLPWPRGQHRKGTDFHAIDAKGGALPLQTWPLAWWPDGSLKWTAHALPAGVDAGAAPRIRPGKGAATGGPRVSVREDARFVEVDTGVIRCRLPREGAQLIHSVQRDGREILGSCTLVAQTDDKPDAEVGGGAVTQTHFQSRTTRLTVEQTGPVRAVVKVDGQHRSAAGREWLPFSVRFYFYAGAESLRVMHTFVFDGDDQKDFLRGIGLRFDVPLRDALYDRHVRFAGQDGGLWAEGVRNLTGLRRDAGAAVREAQLAGRATPPLEQWGAQVRKLQHRIPAWGDYTLSQLSADGFQIRKRTQPGHGWIPAAFGQRAPGSGYIGGATGGVAGAAGHPQRTHRRGAGHHLDALAGGAGHGPALLSRRLGAGDARAGTRRPGDHLRGLRERLRHAGGHRAQQRDHAVGAGRHAQPRAPRADGRRRADAAAAGRPSGALSAGGRVRQAVEPARPRHTGSREDRGQARLPVRLLQEADRAAALVRLLGLRRLPPHL
jgi:hypothetical protein